MTVYLKLLLVYCYHQLYLSLGIFLKKSVNRYFGQNKSLRTAHTHTNSLHKIFLVRQMQKHTHIYVTIATKQSLQKEILFCCCCSSSSSIDNAQLISLEENMIFLFSAVATSTCAAYWSFDLTVAVCILPVTFW